MTKRCSPAVGEMILNLYRDPDILLAVQGDRAAYFDKLGIANEEKEALLEGTFSALARIGVHPLLRMHYMLAINPPMAEHVTIKEFLPALKAEASHG